MRIRSLEFNQQKLNPVTVDISLMPGLPTLFLIGDVSRELRECAPKLKSAFLKQGFKWPRTKQVIVDVRTLDGLAGRQVELAILVALLLATEQIELPNHEDFYFLGEVSLDGQVVRPDWPVVALQTIKDRKVLSGFGASSDYIRQLSDLAAPLKCDLDLDDVPWQRPVLPEIYFSPQAAEFIALVAAGEHHALFAGPHGTGKTTLVDAIHAVLDDLPRPRQIDVAAVHQMFGENVSWRPRIAPHHSSGALAILGGGVPPQHGEITRAHGGLLFLDEYLQFSPKVQEALREPLERGLIRVARGPRAAVFPADFLLLAATNLCACGRLAPGGEYSCSFSLTKCRMTIQRLSGPMLDRFQVLGLSHKWAGARTQSLNTIFELVQKAIGQRVARGQLVPNSKLLVADLENRLAPGVLASLAGIDGSDRRRHSVLRVGQTLADIEGAELVNFEHISRALDYSVNPHYELTRLFA